MTQQKEQCICGDCENTRKAAARYELLRTLSPDQFQKLWVRSLRGRFDDEVDKIIEAGSMEISIEEALSAGGSQDPMSCPHCDGITPHGILLHTPGCPNEVR
jgi:hypothetical protein